MTLIIAGCASYSEPHYYTVRILNHTDQSIIDGYILLDQYKRWAGGGAFPNAGGGGVSLNITKLPDKATFWWEWGDDGEVPPLRAELEIPNIPVIPENIGYYCCSLFIHVLPGYQVKAEVSITYVQPGAKHLTISNTGPISNIAYQEESSDPSSWE